jgi:hypothetical protein
MNVPLRALAGVLWVLALASASHAQDAKYTIQPLKEAPPTDLPAAIKAELAESGLRIQGADGTPLADVWVRKAIPAKSKPGGPEGPVQFPFLAVGELLGAVRYAAEGHDYRDQAIEPGLYTLRFGLHPINGDHLGVSPFRDFGLLLPAATDTDPAPLAEKPLERASAEAAGTNHPAVLLLERVPEGATAGAVRHDVAKDFWGIVLPLPVKEGGASEPQTIPANLLFDAVAAQ